MSGAGAWNRFWFAPASTSTLAVVRIAYGLVLSVWAISLAPDAVDFYSSAGLLAERPSQPGSWSVLAPSSSPWTVAVLLAALVASAAALVLGFHTRLASVLAFVALLSLERQNPFVDNGGDLLLRILGFCLMLAPAGAALSLDRRRKGGGAWWSCPLHAPWALRLMQVQMSAVYLFGVWEKLRGTTWNDGTAISYAWRVQELVRGPLPGWLTESLIVSNALTYGTLAVEAALAVLVWNRRARPWVLAAGVALHACIDFTMVVGFFSMVVLVGYVAFVPPDALDRALLAGRNRMVNRRREIGKGRGPWVLSPLTATARTSGGSAMTSTQIHPRSPFGRPVPRSLGVAAVAVALSLTAAWLASSPASAAPGGPGQLSDCPFATCDPTDDPTGDPTFDPTTADITTEPTDPTGDPTDDPTGDPTDDPTGDPTDPPVLDGDGTGGTDGSGGTETTGATTGTDGGRIVVPTRIDTGAGGSAGGPSPFGMAALVAGALALVGLGARHSTVTTPTSEHR